jgi:hypothetical protein
MSQNPSRIKVEENAGNLPTSIKDTMWSYLKEIQFLFGYIDNNEEKQITETSPMEKYDEYINYVCNALGVNPINKTTLELDMKNIIYILFPMANATDKITQLPLIQIVLPYDDGNKTTGWFNKSFRLWYKENYAHREGQKEYNPYNWKNMNMRYSKLIISNLNKIMMNNYNNNQSTLSNSQQSFKIGNESVSLSINNNVSEQVQNKVLDILTKTSQSSTVDYNGNVILYYPNNKNFENEKGVIYMRYRTPKELFDPIKDHYKIFHVILYKLLTCDNEDYKDRFIGFSQLGLLNMGMFKFQYNGRSATFSLIDEQIIPKEKEKSIPIFEKNKFIYTYKEFPYFRSYINLFFLKIWLECLIENENNTITNCEKIFSIDFYFNRDSSQYSWHQDGYSNLVVKNLALTYILDDKIEFLKSASVTQRKGNIKYPLSIKVRNGDTLKIDNLYFWHTTPEKTLYYGTKIGGPFESTQQVDTATINGLPKFNQIKVQSFDKIKMKETFANLEQIRKEAHENYTKTFGNSSVKRSFIRIWEYDTKSVESRQKSLDVNGNPLFPIQDNYITHLCTYKNLVDTPDIDFQNYIQRPQDNILKVINDVVTGFKSHDSNVQNQPIHVINSFSSTVNAIKTWATDILKPGSQNNENLVISGNYAENNEEVMLPLLRSLGIGGGLNKKSDE